MRVLRISKQAARPLRKFLPVFFLRAASAAFACGTAILLGAAPALAQSPSKVAYSVSVDVPANQFHVSAKAEGVSGPVSFALPAWSPGWYVLTHAYENIHNVTAVDENNAPLTVTQSGKTTWNVADSQAKTVTLSYDVDGHAPEGDKDNGPADLEGEYGFFAPALTKTHGYVPGPASLMYVVNGKTAPCSVTYKVPTGWKIASANNPTDDPATFTAPDYDTLADQPADLGTFTRIDRTVSGVPMSVVLVGAENQNTQAWVSGVFKIAAAGIKAYGVAPFPRYMFIFHFPPSGFAGAGLEHLNCTVITLPVQALQFINGESLSIVAHEYTHAWNVKRVRPAALGPFDYTQPVRVKDLWWLEGTTEYFAPYLVTQAGIGGADFWRGYFVRNINELLSNPARKKVTLETASLKAWEGQSEGFGGLSYYNKGMLVSLLLDIEMRRRSNNRVGIEDLLKALYKEVITTGKGFSEGEIERVASRLAGSDLAPFFNTALRSTDELPFDKILPYAGLKLNAKTTTNAYFGINWDFGNSSENALKINDVIPDGPAAKAGFLKGDVLIKINNKPLSEAAGALFEFPNPGDKLSLTVTRDGASKTLPLTLGSKEETTYRLVRVASPTPAQTAIFDGISGTGQPAPPAKPTKPAPKKVSSSASRSTVR